jgi:sec-independent protein translocase protein TatA
MLEDLFRPTHLIAILVVALLLFGPSKLPQLGDALGKSIRDFKKAVNGQGEQPERNTTSLPIPNEKKEAAQRQG